MWPGADYFHIEEPPFVDPFQDVQDRDMEPRCGWHDTMVVVGMFLALARRLAAHPLPRWRSCYGRSV